MKVLNIFLYPFQLIALALIKIYKILISPIIPKSCKYTPSCSTYAIVAIKRFGLIEGIFLTARRILKCNPHSNGGFDPVPDNIKGEIKWIL